MTTHERAAELLRRAIGEDPDVIERRMFGGLAFLRRGHMLCGVHRGGAMVRVGKVHESQALALDGVTPMTMKGRKMGGFVDVSEAALSDPELRRSLLGWARSFVAGLPPKTSPSQDATLADTPLA